MAKNLAEVLVVGVSSRALFDLELENRIFEEENIQGFRKYQMENEDVVLEKGTAFPLIEALLNLNKYVEEPIVEVVIMSRNSPETGTRVLKSIQHYGLPITRMAFSGGEPIPPFIEAFDVDLFLSKDEKEVQTVIDKASCATALVYDTPADYQPETDRVKFAFDADAVVFSEASEKIYKQEGIEAFLAHEKANENIPLDDGPFANLLRRLSKIQERLPMSIELTPLRIAIVTARSAPSHMRVVNTLRNWGVYVDEAYFMGGLAKDKVLKAFGAHIFFDDQSVHLDDSSKVVPCGRVLYKSDSTLKEYEK